jgi:aminodeoxyfutalosine deaminase
VILRARSVLPVSGPFLENGAVAIGQGRIQAVGAWADVRRAHGGKAVDLGERLLLPGLVNAHCHLDYTGLRGLLRPPKSFPEWIKALVALKAGWSYSEFAQSWLEGAHMLVQTGVTTVADMEAVPELLPEVWTATPLRVISFLELLNVRSWHSARQILLQAEAKLNALPPTQERLGLSPHAPYSTSPELLALAALSARRHGWLLASHVAESREEFDMFTRRQGALQDWLGPQRDAAAGPRESPVRWLARQGLLGPDFLAAHVNYLAPGDASLLAAHHASVVHCPQSHAFFRHQRFPFRELAEQHLNLCLGTDSLASLSAWSHGLPCLNLFSEMRAFAANEPEVSAETIVRMATVNGARALGLDQQIGELTPGASADLIAIPAPPPRTDPYEAVLNHEGDVAASMIRGQWALPPASPR